MIKKVPSDTYNKETDDGAAYQYIREHAGRIKEVYNPYGQLTDTYEYDRRGNVVCHKHSYIKGKEEINTYLKETERAGDIYTYDIRGKQTEKRQLIEADEEGNLLYAISRYIYDDSERLIKDIAYLEKSKDIQEPTGATRIVEREYDDADRLIKVSDSTGASITYEYDSSGNVKKEIKKVDEKRDEITTYIYDKCGRIITERKSELTEQESEAKQEETTKSAEKKQETATRRNRFLSLSEVEARIKQPERIEKIISETKISYDKNGRIAEIRRPEGRIEKIEYDEAGRKLRVQITSEKESDRKYEATYRYEYGCLTEKNENGIVTGYIHNALKNCIEKINPDGGSWTYKYDGNGNIIQAVSPLENARISKDGTSVKEILNGTQYIYNYCGNHIKTISPNKNVLEEKKYDLYGNITEINLADGEIIRYAYDMSGRKIQAETKDGISEKYTYDAWGNITSNATGNIEATYENDQWGRIITVNAPEGVIEHYEYDHSGNIIKATDGAGNIREYRINSFGKADRITYADGVSEYIKYDGEGNAIKHTKRSGKEVSYSYDYLGNITNVKGENDQCEYIYDETGRIIKAKSAGITYDYTYDTSGRLKEKRACGRSLISYTYNLNGNVETLKDVTGKETRYTYDIENHLQTVEDNGQKIASYEYTNGGKVSKIVCGDIETTYSYDTAGNRTGIKVTDGEEELCSIGYSYDERGNCISKDTDGIATSYTYDSLNRLTGEERKHGVESTSYSYAYNKAGNRTSLSKTLYTDNNVKEATRQEYTYNSLNQLHTLSEKTGDTGQSEETTFIYDTDG